MTVRFTAMELGAVVRDSLQLWHYLPETDEWVPVPTSVNTSEKFFIAEADHFSSFGASATGIVETAPLVDGRSVNLQSGSAAFQIPVALPPGRGGLTPQLALSYTSGRMLEMRSPISTSSWLGVGWDLDVPSIQVAMNMENPAFDTSRVFLSMGSGGGELLQEGTEGGDYVWRTRSEQFLKIRSDYDNRQGEWRVWDKNGTKYVFGEGGNSDDEFRRRYCIDVAGPTFLLFTYRFDLSYIEDTLGNRIDFEYWKQYQADPNCAGLDLVKAAYPSRITYNGGQVEIIFNKNMFDDADKAIAGWDQTDQNGQRVRWDTPRPVKSAGCPAVSEWYYPPLVVETRKLTSLEVKVGGALSRRYDFAYTTEGFNFHGDPPCPPEPATGVETAVHRLDRFSFTDRDGNTPVAPGDFTTTELTYWPRSSTRHGEEDGITDVSSFNLPHLQRVSNGLGGYTEFEYQIQGQDAVGTHWSQQVVKKTTQSGEANQPPIVTDFTYPPNTPPAMYRCNDPYHPNVCDTTTASLLGYANVTETTSGTKTIHSFHVPTSSSDYEDEIRAGLEYETVIQDAGSQQWHRVFTTWATTPIANWIDGDCCDHYWVNFVYPSITDTWLRNQIDNTRTQNYFDMTNGNQVGLLDYGVLAITGDGLATNTGYENDTTKWIFKPAYQEVLDPNDSNKLLSCARFYYDGAKTTNPASLTRGLLTAQSQAVDGDTTPCNGTASYAKSASTYSLYDSYGTVLQASVPTDTEPEDPVNAAQTNQLGWIPGGVARSTTAYDSVHGVFPVSQTDPVGNISEMPEADWDFVLGKPKKIIEPTGHTVNITYDLLGRTDKAWDDSYDTSTLPTISYFYSWGAVPNTTKVIERVDHGTANVRTSTSCVDGFGREFETRTQYSGAQVASAWTQYDNRGMVRLKVNPHTYSASSTNCSTPVGYDSSARDRTEFAYDPLGNVTTTTAFGTAVSSQTVAEYNGLVTTLCDENFNKVRRVTNPSARTLTVHEPAATSTSCAATVASNPTVYTYDKLGRLKQVDDPLSNRTTMTYDMAGRKLSMHDPDMGDWTYGYNAAGSLISQRDNRLNGGVTTTLDYDALERLKEKSYSNNVPGVSYQYDSYPDGVCAPGLTSKGKMVRMTDSAGQEWDCYDSRGRVVTKRRSIDAVNYDTSYAYDALGQVKETTYPDGDVVAYARTAQGNITGMTSDVDGAGATYAPQTLLGNVAPTVFGSIGSLALGNGAATTNYTYDYRTRLKTILTPSHQDLTFTYDDASNIKTVVDANLGETITYSYDYLNRLKDATGFQGVASASYSYNAIGNLLTKQEGASNIALAYPASGLSSVRPHAVTSTTGTLARTVHYDKNGNLRKSGDYLYDYDDENRLAAVVKSQARTSGDGVRCMKFAASGNINAGDQLLITLNYGTTKVPNLPTQPNGKYYNPVYDLNGDDTVNVADQLIQTLAFGTACPTTVIRYTHDGNGTLLKRATYAGAHENPATSPLLENIVYVGGVYEKNTVTGSVKKYYQALGRTIAVRDVPTGSGQGTINYLLTDHLGSTTKVLDAGGASVSDARYWPYGGDRLGATTVTDKQFTSQRKEPLDSALGIYNYNARFYSSTLGRFASADPLSGGDGSPQGGNRYSYVLNNPMKFHDPDGLCVQKPDGKYLPCGRGDMIRFFYCAWGGPCDSGGFDESNVRSYARGVVNTFAFIFFVATESALRGDIFLHYNQIGHVEDVLRYRLIPGKAITTGDFYLSFQVNASQRRIVDSYLEFVPNPREHAGIDNPFCNGLACIGGENIFSFGGWDARATEYRDGSLVSLKIEAGPEGTYLGNPFGFFRDVNGVGVELSWTAEFIDGNLTVYPPQFKGVGDFGFMDFPFLNLLSIEADASYQGY
jgi:RHS repeat-associated protein